MSVDGVTFLGKFERDAFEWERAEAFALDYAGGARSATGGLLSLSKLHEAAPNWYPPPFVILRWRETIPRFRLLMEEAERCRAVVLLEECVDIADDTGRLAAQARNAMDARMKIAERFDSRRFGARQVMAGDQLDSLNPENLADLSDDVLLGVVRAQLVGRAAVGGVVTVIENESGTETDSLEGG